jgi:FKBP-type peptidyl-prolyl cis-trans isomerase 2
LAARAGIEKGTGSVRYVVSHQVKEKTIVNHPLAGKTLNFDVKVKDIKAAAER